MYLIDEREARRAIIIKPTPNLAALPPVSEIDFPGYYAWSPIPTGPLTAALHIDRGLWGTWKCRGLTPAPLPSEWFRQSTGNPQHYRVDHVLAWIAARRGEPFDQIGAWRRSILNLSSSQKDDDPRRVRGLAKLFAEVTAKRSQDIRFTATGLAAYLATFDENAQ